MGEPKLLACREERCEHKNEEADGEHDGRQHHLQAECAAALPTEEHDERRLEKSDTTLCSPSINPFPPRGGGYAIIMHQQ